MTLTPPERAELRARHTWGHLGTDQTVEGPVEVFGCQGCGQTDEEGTCSTIRLLDALEAAEARLEEAESEVEARGQKIDALYRQLEDAEAVRDTRAEQAAKWMDRAGLLLKERDEILDKLEKMEYHLVELCEVAGRLTGMTYEDIAKIERPSSEARACLVALATARRESRNLLRKRS